MSNLLTKDYDTLFVDDFILNGKIAQVLNSQGYSHKTVCPECSIDDFTHVEGCSKLELIKDI
jgi:hypothetical protein